MPRKSIPMSIVYDFDGTLAPGNMQEHNFLPAIKVRKEVFWEEVGEKSSEQGADEILVYMYLMLEKASISKIPITKAAFTEHGKNIQLFEGVENWFKNINKYAKSKSVQIDHYLISSGNEEIIMATSIKKQFKKIFASKYLFDVNDVAIWPALAVNYTTKTQFLFRINKGALDVSDTEGVNKHMPKEKRPMPFENMIFIGDGTTDIPSFSLITDMGGMSIAVYKPHTKHALEKATEHVTNGRVYCALPADYSKEEAIYKAVCRKIDVIAAKYELKKYKGCSK